MSLQDIQKIKGVGPKYAQKLSDAGITTLADLASATPEQLAQIIQARGGIAHYDNWISQAQALLPPQPEAPASGAEPAAKSEDVFYDELQSLVDELNTLAGQLRDLEPRFRPPKYSPQRMMSLLKENVDRFAPESIKGLQESLEGTSISDFKDIETWKGVWFTLNYLVKLEAAEKAGPVAQRLLKLPGVSTLADLKEMLQDTPPEEFLNPETWKGMWFLVNYELRNTAGGMKRRFLGEQTAEDEE